jgi:hypothetical protein
MKMKKAKFDVLNNVDFVDLIRTYVYVGSPTKEDPHPLRVEFRPLDESKKVVFDESALTKMNEILTGKARQYSLGDQKFRTYLEEFATRLASELHRNGLAEIVDVEESPDDHYASLR